MWRMSRSYGSALKIKASKMGALGGISSLLHADDIKVSRPGEDQMVSAHPTTEERLMKAEIKRLKALAAELFSYVRCEEAHHRPKEYHTQEEACPVMARLHTEVNK